MNAFRQLSLPFAPAPHYAAADLVAAPSNAEARAWLARPTSWPEGRLALSGEAGCGKTHLLHLWSAEGGGEMLAGPFLRALPRTLARRLAVDDADACPDEAVLLHLLNATREARCLVLLAGRTLPARWKVELPDLTSRLRALTAVSIGPAEDALLRPLLARLFAERQLRVSPLVQDFLLARLPRTPAALREAAARLDRRALATGGRISRPLAALVIAELGGEVEPAPAVPPGEFDRALST